MRGKKGRDKGRGEVEKRGLTLRVWTVLIEGRQHRRCGPEHTIATYMYSLPGETKYGDRSPVERRSPRDADPS